jgi:hypothetical protein
MSLKLRSKVRKQYIVRRHCRAYLVERIKNCMHVDRENLDQRVVGKGYDIFKVAIHCLISTIEFQASSS